MMTQFEDRMIENLRRIADALETIAGAIDPQRLTLRMVDVDRAKVYSTHLGEKLKGNAEK